MVDTPDDKTSTSSTQEPPKPDAPKIKSAVDMTSEEYAIARKALTHCNPPSHI